MNVLLVCDDVWHPAEVIERGLKAMDHSGIDFDLVRTAKDILTPAFVRRYDALVNCSGGSINAANSASWFEPSVTEFGPEEFRDYVAGGGGLVVVHAGLTIGGPACPAPAYTEAVG
ncbi:MAG: ThuA domain-containing protein, partial [Clostridia bacterium]|nr:ThuA domain-containing protein [Clostridia bacterium]